MYEVDGYLTCEIYFCYIITPKILCDQEVMEFHVLFSTTVISIFAFQVIAFLLQILRRKRINIVKKRAAPQEKGAWPIIGHLHLLGGYRPPQEVLGHGRQIWTYLYHQTWCSPSFGCE
ncbi:putative protopine 6-monooxygenase [Helianthus annuus]|nr:putative protopine 6-monooxygenase [Helianthus annuus]